MLFLFRVTSLNIIINAEAMSILHLSMQQRLLTVFVLLFSTLSNPNETTCINSLSQRYNKLIQ